jgi:methionine-rich copper-binding protein CopC
MKRFVSAGFLLLSVVPNFAFAHAHLKSARPAKGSIVRVAPSKVTLEFTEDVESSMSKIEVKDAKSGEIMSVAPAVYSGPAKNSLEIKLKALKPEKQMLRVEWKAISKDSHKMQDKFDFTFDPKAE